MLQYYRQWIIRPIYKCDRFMLAAARRNAYEKNTFIMLMYAYAKRLWQF